MLPKQDNDEFETKQEQKDTDKQVQPVYTKCTLHEFFNLVQQTRDIYDLRPVDAFQKSHLYGAKNIPAPMKLAKFQSQNVLHLPVVLYGDKQSTSEAVLVHLATLIAAAADRNTRVYAFDGEYESDIVRKCLPMQAATVNDTELSKHDHRGRVVLRRRIYGRGQRYYGRLGHHAHCQRDVHVVYVGRRGQETHRVFAIAAGRQHHGGT